MILKTFPNQENEILSFKINLIQLSLLYLPDLAIAS